MNANDRLLRPLASTDRRAAGPGAMNSGMKQDYLIEAVHRSAVICEVFDGDHPAWDLPKLARRCGIPQRTLIRIVETLVRRDFLLRLTDGRLRLGPRWLSLSQKKLEATNIRDIAARVMREMREKLDETYVLGVRQGRNRLIEECLVSTQPIRRLSAVGFETPLHVGSGGRAIMSKMTDFEIDEYLSGTLLANVGYDTVTDPARVRDDIRMARIKGYLTSRAEITRESFSCSAPILDHAGRVTASFTITLPLIRLTDELEARAIAISQEGARKISGALGHAEK